MKNEKVKKSGAFLPLMLALFRDLTGLGQIWYN